MKYRIFIPAFVKEIEAKNKEEALEIFDEAYDNARDDIEFGTAIIEEIKN